MARKAASIEDLRLKYDEDLRAALAGDSPLACVIISAALTEKALVTLLSNCFVKCETSVCILSEKGALSDFSKCADAAYCLGLISDGMLENLKSIGKIRNLFAHAHEFIDFDNPDVEKLCSQLTANKGWFLMLKDKGKPGVSIETHLASKSARERFAYICSASCMSLIGKAAETKHRDRAKDTWMRKKTS